MDCYIYFKAAAGDEAAVLQQQARLQALLAEACGCSARLQRRPASGEEVQTWMEIYRSVPPDFEAKLAQALAQTGLPDLLLGERHAEYFLDIDPCA